MTEYSFEIHEAVPVHDFSQIATIYCLANDKTLDADNYLKLQYELKAVDGLGIARRESVAVAFMTYRRLWRTCR